MASLVVELSDWTAGKFRLGASAVHLSSRANFGGRAVTNNVTAVLAQHLTLPKGAPRLFIRGTLYLTSSSPKYLLARWPSAGAEIPISADNKVLCAGMIRPADAGESRRSNSPGERPVGRC